MFTFTVLSSSGVVL